MDIRNEDASLIKPNNMINNGNKQRYMKKLIILLFLPIIMYSQDACMVYGKIKFVEFNEDYRVKIVNFNEDVKVKFVDRFHERSGRWEIVDMFEDYKIKLVKYDPDFTIKEVDFFEGCR